MHLSSSLRPHLTGPATTSLLLRLGLAAVLLTFGVGKFVDTVGWLAFIPPWMVPLVPIPLEVFMRVVGGVEVILGALLVIGWQVRVVAILVALHLAGVLIALGYNEIAVRDFGLFMAALALAALGHGGCHYSLDGRSHQGELQATSCQP